MNRVPLLFVISDLGGGGAERELINVANAMDRARFTVHLALWRDERRYAVHPDTDVVLLDKHRVGDLPGVVRRTRALIRRLRPALVYSVLPFPNLSVAAARVGLHPRPRWIARIVNTIDYDVPLWLRPALRRALLTADEVHGCSIGVSRGAERDLRLPPGRVRVFDNPIDLEATAAGPSWTGARPDAPLLVWAGRLVPAKRPDRLLAALARVRTPFVCWIFGVGPEEAALRDQIVRLGLEGRVVLQGFSAEIHGAFRMARAVVVTSHSEGFCNVIVEAMACGTPCVSTDCRHGPAELIVDGVSGRLVPEDDADALVAAIEQALEEPAKAAAWAVEAGRRIHARFAHKRAIVRYTTRIAELAAPGR